MISTGGFGFPRTGMGKSINTKRFEMMTVPSGVRVASCLMIGKFVKIFTKYAAMGYGLLRMLNKNCALLENASVKIIIIVKNSFDTSHEICFPTKNDYIKSKIPSKNIQNHETSMPGCRARL